MKCNEPKPGDSWRACDRELLHSGPHRYLNETWPRPVPSEPDPEVEAVLDRTKGARSWGLDERRYPIVVVETITRVMWADAESEDEALAMWDDDPSDAPLKESHVLNADLEFRRLEDHERDEAFRVEMGREFGPRIQCPDCRRLAFQREWFHDPYSKCHGPIVWRQHPGARRPWREHNATPVHNAAKAVTAP